MFPVGEETNLVFQCSLQCNKITLAYTQSWDHIVQTYSIVIMPKAIQTNCKLTFYSVWSLLTVKIVVEDGVKLYQFNEGGGGDNLLSILVSCLKSLSDKLCKHWVTNSLDLVVTSMTINKIM